MKVGKVVDVAVAVTVAVVAAAAAVGDRVSIGVVRSCSRGVGEREAHTAHRMAVVCGTVLAAAAAVAVAMVRAAREEEEEQTRILTALGKAWSARGGRPTDPKLRRLKGAALKEPRRDHSMTEKCRELLPVLSSLAVEGADLLVESEVSGDDGLNGGQQAQREEEVLAAAASPTVSAAAADEAAWPAWASFEPAVQSPGALWRRHLEERLGSPGSSISFRGTVQ